MSNIFSVFNISSSSFENIIISKHIITLYNINRFSIENTIFHSINLVYYDLFKAGGCIRTQNVLKRTFFNLTIFNTFSEYTAPGLKIIDEKDKLLLLSSLYNFNENIAVNQKF